MYPRNAASPPRISIGAVVQISDGAVQSSGVSVVVRPEGGAESAGGGTVAYSAASNVVYYTPTQAETNYTAFCVIAYKTGCFPVEKTIITTATAVPGTVDVGAISGDSAAADNLELACDNYSATRGLAGTALPNAAADAAGGLVISDAGGLNIDTVASNVTAILVDTGTSIPASLVTIDSIVDDILDDTATSIPTLINTVDSVVDQILVDTAEIGAAGAGLSNIPWNASWDTQVESEVNDALVAIHLDHLLAVDYDPASKPGTSTALLNELIESNGGVSRYTAAALAQAPSGTGGDATAANQTTILNHLTDIKGGTFSGATDSLEAIRDRGDSAWTTGAGGSDRLLMVDTTIATLGSQTNFTLTSGSADNDAYNGCTIVIEDASTATQKAVGVVSDYVGSSRTVTLIADPAVFTMAASDKVYILAERSVKSSSASSFFINAGDVASEASVQSVDTAVGNILSALPTNFTDMTISAGTGYVIASSVQGNVTGSVGSVLGGINTTGGTITTLDALDTAQDVEHNATQATLAALNNLSAAQVNAEVDTALADIHLDHLLATDYDPASKPGVATALLNELIESDAGVSRYTANALEQAPAGGGGGDATAANQTTIITHLTDIKGAGWSSTTDTLEKIRDAISGVGGAIGSGSVEWDIEVLSGGNPVDGASVWVTTDEAGTNVIAGTLYTDSLGMVTFMLDPGTYYVWTQKSGVNFTNPTETVVA